MDQCGLHYQGVIQRAGGFLEAADCPHRHKARPSIQIEDSHASREFYVVLVKGPGDCFEAVAEVYAERISEAVLLDPDIPAERLRKLDGPVVDDYISGFHAKKRRKPIQTVHL
jgi:hypothetical protein